MCGRYTNTKDLSGLMQLVEVVLHVAFNPRYNIAPTQMAPVVFMDKNKPTLKPMRWGLIPAWAKDEGTGNALINARAETETALGSGQGRFHRRPRSQPVG